MKRWLLAAAAASALATAARGADVPSAPQHAPAQYAPAYVPSWTGSYLGINGGYGAGTSRWTDTATGASSGSFGVDGGMVGGTLGYNMQLGTVVLGLEGDIDWSSLKGSTSTNCGSGCRTANDWLGTARGRIGYAFDRFMPFVSGGLAYGQVKGATPGGTGFSDTALGWTAGAGVEYSFLTKWSAKLEYLYTDLGNARCNGACSGADPFDARFNANLVRAGLNYRF